MSECVSECVEALKSQKGDGLSTLITCFFSGQWMKCKSDPAFARRKSSCLALCIEPNVHRSILCSMGRGGGSKRNSVSLFTAPTLGDAVNLALDQRHLSWLRGGEVHVGLLEMLLLSSRPLVVLVICVYVDVSVYVWCARVCWCAVQA